MYRICQYLCSRGLLLRGLRSELLFVETRLGTADCMGAVGRDGVRTTYVVLRSFRRVDLVEERSADAPHLSY